MRSSYPSDQNYKKESTEVKYDNYKEEVTSKFLETLKIYFKTV